MTNPNELHWKTAPSIPAEALAPWDALTRDQSPIVDAALLRCFCEAFATARWAPTVHLLYRGDQLVAGVPMARAGGLARAWTSFENEHYPYWRIAGALDASSAEALLAHLLEADAADYVFMRRLHLDSPTCSTLLEAAARMRLEISLNQSEYGDARVAIRGPWDAFRATLPKDYKDLPRKQRQLEKQGQLALQRITDTGPELDAALRACFELETRGWKGRHGSPIQADPRTLRFYTELAHALARRRKFRLYTLRFDGALMAFQLCLHGGGHLELLKESYDPAFAAKSPGQLIRMMVLRQLFEDGDTAWYHMGRANPHGDPQAWKLRWATEVAPLCTLRIYGTGLRARGAYLAGPVLRGRLKQSRQLMKHAWRRHGLHASGA